MCVRIPRNSKSLGPTEMKISTGPLGRQAGHHGIRVENYRQENIACSTQTRTVN